MPHLSAKFVIGRLLLAIVFLQAILDDEIEVELSEGPRQDPLSAILLLDGNIEPLAKGRHSHRS